MFKCKYCGKEFENKNQLGGHIVWCKENPNRSGKCNFNKRKNNKVVQKQDYICQYCGKIVGNAGCLTLHERYCDKNPNKELWVKKDTYKSTSHVAWNKGLTAETDERVNKGRLSLRKSIETGKYISKKFKHTEEAKEKIRISSINYIKSLKGGYKTRYNISACKYINELNEKMNWNLQHAENGGEVQICGYFVDGYDKDLNIVFEYDEEYHYKDVFNNILKDKDINRQNYIISKINCKFYRYNRRLDLFYEVK